MTTVVANLSSDMRTAAPLTQGGLLLSRQLGARWSSVACGVACWGYYVGVIMVKLSSRIHLPWQTGRRGVGGASGSTMRLGNTRSIVPPGQRIASASVASMRVSTFHNECSGG